MKKLLLLILSVTLVFTMSCPVFADDETVVYDLDSYLLENDLPESEGWIQPRDMQASTWSNNSILYTFKKTSATTCKAQVIAQRPAATYVKSTIQVQIKNTSGYNTIGNGTATKSVYDDSINHIATFSISSRKTYRAKIAVKYTQEGISTTDYYYVGLDSNGF